MGLRATGWALSRTDGSPNGSLTPSSMACKTTWPFWGVRCLCRLPPLQGRRQGLCPKGPKRAPTVGSSKENGSVGWGGPCLSHGMHHTAAPVNGPRAHLLPNRHYEHVFQPQAELGLGAMVHTALRGLCMVGDTDAETGHLTKCGKAGSQEAAGAWRRHSTRGTTASPTATRGRCGECVTTILQGNGGACELVAIGDF